MSILPGNTESEQVISCLFACKEGLSIDMGNLPLEVVHLNAEGTVLTLKVKCHHLFKEAQNFKRRFQILPLV